jgi:hypothetical protein
MLMRKFEFLIFVFLTVTTMVSCHSHIDCGCESNMDG